MSRTGIPCRSMPSVTATAPSSSSDQPRAAGYPVDRKIVFRRCGLSENIQALPQTGLHSKLERYSRYDGNRAVVRLGRNRIEYLSGEDFWLQPVTHIDLSGVPRGILSR
jgi:hypothetical protein